MLHIYSFIADIIIVLIFIIVLFSIIIFPIFFNVKIYYSKEINKVFFKLYLFNFIRIIKGYAEKIEEGFAFHLSKSKAIILPYKNLLGMRKKFKPIQDYHIIKFHLEINYSNNANNFNAIILSNVLQIINNNILKILCYNKPYLNIYNVINVYEDKDLFNIKCSFTTIFNILMILISLIKILMEKFIYAIKSIKN